MNQTDSLTVMHAVFDPDGIAKMELTEDQIALGKTATTLVHAKSVKSVELAREIAEKWPEMYQRVHWLRALANANTDPIVWDVEWFIEELKDDLFHLPPSPPQVKIYPS